MCIQRSHQLVLLGTYKITNDLYGFTKYVNLGYPIIILNAKIDNIHINALIYLFFDDLRL